MDSMTYLDFAENDYKYFMHSYESGYVANNMAANAQNTAEKYLKHLIDQYDHDEQRLDLRTRTLRTHNLSQLMNYLSNEMGMEIPLRVKRDINALNNYYFNARYPGDNSFFVSKDDIEICKEGLDSCRELVLSVDKEMRTKNKVLNMIFLYGKTYKLDYKYEKTNFIYYYGRLSALIYDSMFFRQEKYEISIRTNNSRYFYIN